MQYTAKTLNTILQNIYLRNFIFIIAGVFMGYTLQPVPVWLNHLFNTSQLLKFGVLFISGVSVLYPMDENKMTITLGCSILALFVFYIFRNKKMEEKMHKILNIEEEKQISNLL